MKPSVLLAISPKLSFTKSGRAQLLELQCCETGDRYIIVLSLVALENTFLLQLGFTYQFYGLKPCRSRGLDSQCAWYAANDRKFRIESFSNSPSIKATSCIAATVEYLYHTHIHVVLPKDTIEKARLEIALFLLTGRIGRFNKHCGYFELNRVSNNNSGFTEVIHEGVRVFLCPQQEEKLQQWKSLAVGTIVTISYLLPVYLWGRLYGFTTTVKSSMTSVLEEKKGEVDDTPNSLNTSAATENRPMKSPRLPGYVYRTCAMYSAWRASLIARLTRALGAASTTCNRIGNMHAVLLQVIENFSGEVTDVGYPAEEAIVLGSPSSPSVLQKLCEKPTYSVLDEFACPAYVQSEVVSAGHDGDWLSSQMPKVFAVEDLYSLSLSLSKRIVAIRRRFFEHRIDAYTQVWTAALHGVRTSSLGRDGAGDFEEHFAELSMPAGSGGSQGSYRYADFQRLEIVIGIVSRVVLLPTNPISGCNMLVHFTLKNISTCIVFEVILVLSSLNMTHRLLDRIAYAERLIRSQSGDNSASLPISSVTPATHPRIVLVVRNPLLYLSVAPDSFQNNSKYAARAILLTQEHNDVRILFEESDDAAAAEPRRRLDIFHSNVSVGMVRADGAEANASLSHVKLTVRDLLLRDLVGGGACAIPEVIGTVIFKTATFESSRNNYSKAADESGTSKRMRLAAKCSFQIVDISSLNMITVYAPLTIASAVMVGFTICIRKSVLSVAENGRNSYLKLEDGPSNIVVVDVVSNEILGRLCEISREIDRPFTAALAWKLLRPVLQPLSHPSLHDIPRTRVSHLISTRMHNRCLWRLVGSVSFVKSVGVYMRCTKCLSPVTGKSSASSSSLSASRFYCCKCKLTTYLEPLWQAVFAFDDGTGECIVHVESKEEVLRLLSFPFGVNLPPSAEEVTYSDSAGAPGGCTAADKRDYRCRQQQESNRVIELAEQIAKVYGSIKYNSMFTKGASSIGFDGYDDDFQDTSGGTASLKVGRKTIPSWATDEMIQAEDDFMLYVQRCVPDTSYELLAKIIFKKDEPSNGTDARAAGESSSSGPSLRLIQMQAANANTPWFAPMRAIRTLSVPQLTLEALALRSMGPEDVIRETRALLEEYKSRYK